MGQPPPVPGLTRGLAQPHHDGSALYVTNPQPGLHETVTLFARAPHEAGVSRAAVRSTPNAEPLFTEGRLDRSDDREAWWRFDVVAENPVTSYRFLLDGPAGYRWLTAGGVAGWDVPDATDFRLLTFDPPPAWVGDAVFYQIFPDRFARAGGRPPEAAWAIPAEWEHPVLGDGKRAVRQLYGGDLPGIREHLDHLERLGVNAVYLTPFFPAESSHRYNASSFEQVEPILGGDHALADLVASVHARGMRIIGDLTLNHCGNTHEWFRTAQRDPASPEAGFFFRGLEDFEYWFGVRTLPKFDHRSDELRRRLYDGPDSAVARWLRPPFELDGWRIDVANMAGRFRDIDLNGLCARATRQTMRAVRPDTYLVAEHGHDASADLVGDGWHGTMSYAGFTRPLWCWLGDPTSLRDRDFLGVPFSLPALGGRAIAETIDAFRAAIPWRSWTHNMTLLGSHDTARWRSVAADRDRALVGSGVLLTFPGVPSIFAGDELGLEGTDSNLARVPMPWDPARWDGATLEAYRSLVGLRKGHPALRGGGFRWVHVGEETLVYLRETADERILLQASRAAHQPVTLGSAGLGLDGLAGSLLGGPDLTAVGDTVSLPAEGPAFHAWRL